MTTPELTPTPVSLIHAAPEPGKPDRRSPARVRSAHIDATAATARRCLRAERIVLTAVAMAMLVAFFLRGGCIDCVRTLPAVPADPDAAQVFGWPI